MLDIEAIARRFDENHSAVTAALTKAAQRTDAADTKAAEALSKAGELAIEFRELQQKLAGVSGGGRPLAQKSWGEQFIEAPELKEFAADTMRPRRLRLDMKTTITTGSTSGGPLTPPARDTVNPMPRRRLVVRDLLNVIGVGGASVEYPRQTGRTNNAAPVAEGDAKPESAYAFELVSVPLRVIAHWVPASRQVVEDSTQLRDIINSELLYGLSLAEETQLLLGSGSGQNLTGLVPNATAYSAPFSITSPTMIDVLGLAILQSSLADFPPDGIVIHPSDWARIRLEKDSEGNYIMGPPGQDVAPMLFGLPVVATPAMTVDKFLVGNFAAAATLYDRWTPRVEVSTEHSDFFVRNLVAILAEERIAVAIKRAAAVTFGDFGNS
jgi:HK97 family phage major capsid protein